jgi:hypothetical protein
VDIQVIWVFGKPEYFFKRGWTHRRRGRAVICPSGRLASVGMCANARPAINFAIGGGHGKREAPDIASRHASSCAAIHLRQKGLCVHRSTGQCKVLWFIVLGARNGWFSQGSNNCCGYWCGWGSRCSARCQLDRCIRRRFEAARSPDRIFDHVQIYRWPESGADPVLSSGHARIDPGCRWRSVHGRSWKHGLRHRQQVEGPARRLDRPVAAVRHHDRTGDVA